MRTMLSWLNCFLTLCLTALLILYSFSDLSHNFFSPSPSLQVQAQVYVFDGIQLIQKKGKVRLALNITADFRSLFSWNTEQIFVFVAAEYVTPINSVNQISLWDRIVTTKEKARFHVQARVKDFPKLKVFDYSRTFETIGKDRFYLARFFICNNNFVIMD
ncbi:signal peptidase complex subunit 3A [Cryptomeria japonica]|uniref:signal peptidase complex subunit 3A n=1 Tax=Cryptomeria japonica TaxID=3369 RepID=UPI0027DA7DE0|nr:signal peptidase complex subunit 3A [Cryptomeria japonica]XP_059073859.1 signal peptidase complex subunit 3A [Cryptomeria japonica]